MVVRHSCSYNLYTIVPPVSLSTPPTSASSSQHLVGTPRPSPTPICMCTVCSFTSLRELWVADNRLAVLPREIGQLGTLERALLDMYCRDLKLDPPPLIPGGLPILTAVVLCCVWWCCCFVPRFVFFWGGGGTSCHLCYDDRAGAGARLLLRHGSCHGRRRGSPSDRRRRTPSC